MIVTSFIERGIRMIFRTERKAIHWPSRPVAIISANLAIWSIYHHNPVLENYTNSSDRLVLDNQHFCRLVHHIVILAHTKARKLVCCQDAGLITIETHCNILERRCPMNTCGLVGILPGKPFYANVSTLTAKSVNVANFMIVVIVSSTCTCMVHACDDEPPRRNTTHQKSRQSDRAKNEQSMTPSTKSCWSGVANKWINTGSKWSRPESEHWVETGTEGTGRVFGVWQQGNKFVPQAWENVRRPLCLDQNKAALNQAWKDWQWNNLFSLLLSKPNRERIWESKDRTNAPHGCYRAFPDRFGIMHFVRSRERQHITFIRRLLKTDYNYEPGVVPKTTHGRMYQLMRWRYGNLDIRS